MSRRFTALQRTRFALFLRILLVSAVIGGAYGVLLAKGEASPLAGGLHGIANAILIAGAIAAIEIFLLREGSPMNRLLRVPFIVLVAGKTLVYSAIVVTVVTGTARAGRPLDAYTEMVTVGFSLAITAIFVITLQAATLIGRRTFRDLVLGRYRQPRAERRFFLFVDIVGSTALGERLGAMEAHRFLAAVFSATAEPIAACRGEIYQYVGDEIVVTWTEAEGRPEARPLRCFFAMRAALAARAPEFRARYGTEPELRAALHLGEVIAGEVGEQRRAIVFHGDVMNTASRLEQATRELGVRFIASADSLRVLDPAPEMEFTDLGAVALRGRQVPIRASSVALRS